MRKGQNRVARRWAEQALVDAQLATARSAREQARDDVAELARAIEALREALQL
jgi:hypothetical protein